MAKRSDDRCPAETVDINLAAVSARSRDRYWSWTTLRVTSALTVLLLSGLFLSLLAKILQPSGLYYVLGALLVVFPVLVATLMLLDHLAICTAIRQQQGSWLNGADILSAFKRFPQLFQMYRPIWRAALTGFYGNLLAFPIIILLGLLLSRVGSLGSAGFGLFILALVLLHAITIKWIRRTIAEANKTAYDPHHLERQYSLLGGKAPACYSYGDLTEYRWRMASRCRLGGLACAIMAFALLVIPIFAMLFAHDQSDAGAVGMVVLISAVAPFPIPTLPSIALAGILVGWAWNIPYLALARVIASQPTSTTTGE